ncbi:unnamed protein product [Amoebophrya sp. A120]|nr:unnamed protein product [Amoebophrya sp. A120]|eukprot:GSA120T00021896001.1
MAPDLVSSSRIPRAPVRPGGGHARTPLCFSAGLALLFAVRLQLLFDAGAAPLVHLAMGLQGGGRKAQRTNNPNGASRSAPDIMESVKMTAYCWRLAAEVQLTCHEQSTSFDANVEREAKLAKVRDLSKAMSIKEKVARVTRAAEIVSNRMQDAMASSGVLETMQKQIDDGTLKTLSAVKREKQFPARVWDWWLSQKSEKLWSRVLLVRAGARCFGARKQLRQSTYQGRDVSCEEELYGPGAAARRRTSSDDAAKLKAQIDHDYAVGKFTDDGLVELLTTADKASKKFDQQYKQKVSSNRHLFKNLDAAPGAAGGGVPLAQARGAKQQGAGATAWDAFSPTEEDEETSEDGGSTTASNDEQGGRPSYSGAGPRGGGGNREERRGRRTRKAEQRRERLLEKAKALAAEAEERDLEALLGQLSQDGDEEYKQALDQALQRPELVPASVTAAPKRPGRARGTGAHATTAGSDARLDRDIPSPAAALAAISRRVQQIRRRSASGRGMVDAELVLDVFIASLGTLCRDVYAGLPYFRAERMDMMSLYFSGVLSLNEHLLKVLCPGPQLERSKTQYMSSYEKNVEVDGTTYNPAMSTRKNESYDIMSDSLLVKRFLLQSKTNGSSQLMLPEGTEARADLQNLKKIENWLSEHKLMLSELLSTEYARRTRGAVYMWGIEQATRMKKAADLIYVSEVEAAPAPDFLKGLIAPDLQNRWTALLDAIIELWQQELRKAYAPEDRFGGPSGQARERVGILKELGRLVAESHGKGFSERIDDLRNKVTGENFGHFPDGEHVARLSETTTRDLVWLKRRWESWLREKENRKLTSNHATQRTFVKVVRQIQADILFAGEPRAGREPPELEQLGDDQKAQTARLSSGEALIRACKMQNRTTSIEKLCRCLSKKKTFIFGRICWDQLPLLLISDLGCPVCILHVHKVWGDDEVPQVKRPCPRPIFSYLKDES